MRALDLALRFLFFAAVPFVATFVAVYFPMTPLLLNLTATLAVFAAAEVVRRHAEQSPILSRLMARRLAFEEHYQDIPAPVLVLRFYPLLLPYVLSRPDTRRELGYYRGFTGFGLSRSSWRRPSPTTGSIPARARGARSSFGFRWPCSPFRRSASSSFSCRWPRRWEVPRRTTPKRALALARRGRHLGVRRGGKTRAAPRTPRPWATTRRVELRTQEDGMGARLAGSSALRAVLQQPLELRDNTDQKRLG